MTSDRPILLVEAGLRGASLIDFEPLAGLTERHKLALTPGESFPVTDVLASAASMQVLGIVLALDHGVPSTAELALMADALRRHVRCYVYWPAEEAVEVVDAIRLKSFRQQAWFYSVASPLWGWFGGRSAKVRTFARELGVGRVISAAIHRLRLPEMLRLLRLLVRMPRPYMRMARGVPPSLAFTDEGQIHADARSHIDKILARAAPVAFPQLHGDATPRCPVDGLGVYLRLDYWVPFSSGGSFGHTCYVAKQLAASSEDFVCFMASRYQLLDDLGVRQVVLPAQAPDGSEIALLMANKHYLTSLQAAMAVTRPAYIYERLCLGNYVGAESSQEFGIPYIVEYNGSEVSMARSFGGQQYRYEDLLELAEMAAFKQATVISVVSGPIREALIQRGVDAAKILVNPNGAQPDVYAPPAPDVRAELRSSLGFDNEHCVVGFTGTFGGWHGIDVLADSLPRICAGDETVRFLLVGDGANKHLVDSAIERNGLADRCVSAGRVSQQRGAVLLGACDIFVSPHNAHMVDSRFFGSPTKIFEYMSMGGGIVASDLEQIGQVLSPALRTQDFHAAEPEAGDARAVLCRPGDVTDFVEGVLALSSRARLRHSLGANARQAILDQFSWQRHVEKLWAFAVHPPQPDLESPAVSRSVAMAMATEQTAAASSALVYIDTGDSYKDEVQRQWNVDACGSQYVHGIQPDSLEWYLEAERYRYQEYGPWMHETMEFAGHAGEQVLEVGGGMGTDLAQFAANGAHTTDVDLSAGHLRHAQRSFALRGLEGKFVHQDAEVMPFDDNTFDVVYSNGVIHHTPNTQHVIDEMWRVLRPGGKVIAMVYAEHSWHYWRALFWGWGITDEMLRECSIGEIMSRGVELSSEGQRPLVKVYTAERLRAMFARFNDLDVVKRQLTRPELPRLLRWVDPDALGKVMGWNLVIKGRKPHA